MADNDYVEINMGNKWGVDYKMISKGTLCRIQASPDFRMITRVYFQIDYIEIIS